MGNPNRKKLHKAQSASGAKHIISKRKLLLFTPLIIVLSLAAAYGLSLVAYKHNLSRHQERMTTYLERKYGKRFHVNNVHEQGYGIGSAPDIIGEGSPEDNPKAKFSIINAFSSYKDNYPGALWASQERPKVEAVLNDIYDGHAPKFDVTISVPQAVYDRIGGTIPSLASVTQERPRELGFAIIIDAHGGSSDADRRYHAQKAYKIIEYLRGLPQFRASLAYRVFTGGDELSADYGYGCGLSVTEAEKISNAEGLVGLNCFR